MSFQFDNTYAQTLQGFYEPAQAAPCPSPHLVQLNEELAETLGLSVADLRSRGHEIFSGQSMPNGACSIAQVYAGHQFGGFNPQLGDGRALLMGEIVDAAGLRWDIQLKGSGPTTFSRGGDGLAALGPVLREYLMGEALHALGVPTTRMLAAVTTGRIVYRETPRPGAVVTRIASSHIRIGTFEYFAARGDKAKLNQLLDYTIERHYPDLRSAPDRPLALLAKVCDVQATLIARWMLVGFIHGVMNTDNVAISGQTIDFGPCAFMDSYKPSTVFSSIDHHGRYRYENQPAIGLWNMTRFAESLLSVFDEPSTVIPEAKTILERFQPTYLRRWRAGMARKLGWPTAAHIEPNLIDEWLDILATDSLDYTAAMRGLNQAISGTFPPIFERMTDKERFQDWLHTWRTALANSGIEQHEAIRTMNAANPIYIPRNHLVEEALERAVEHHDLTAFETLLDRVRSPYEPLDTASKYEHAAPLDFTRQYKTFCGT